ncbi:MAG TPA: hypothetical protein VMF31_10635 [Solirubrobacterales bacterium]|nr:hypothetical protein [Solirubrobacterales bacterium]
MTVKELKAEAKRRGITLPSRAKKAEIEELLGIGVERTVVAGVERDLAELAKRAPALLNTALAATALELAKQLDSKTNSATSKSMCAKSLTETMDRLDELAPPKKEGDRLDALAARHADRRT